MPTVLYKLLALLVAFAAVLLGTYAVAGIRAERANTLGFRGRRRVRSVANHRLWAAVEPTVRVIAGRVGPLLSARERASLDRSITLAGDPLGLQPEELIAVSVLCGLLGLSMGAYTAYIGYPVILAAIVSVAFPVYPFLKLNSLQQNRLSSISRSLPHAVDLMSLSLAAGADFTGAIRQILQTSGSADDPLVEELGLVLQETQIGKTRTHALRQLARRVPSESVKEFVSAVIQAEEHGTPLAEVLRIQAAVSRQHRSMRAERAAARASVKMLLPMMLLLSALMTLIFGPILLGVGDAFNR